MIRCGSIHSAAVKPRRFSSAGIAPSSSHCCIAGSAPTRVVTWLCSIGTRINSARVISTIISANTSSTAVLRERPAASSRSTSGSPSQASISEATNGVRIGASNQITQTSANDRAPRLIWRRKRAISSSGATWFI
jgi:hypothetical protein